MHSRLLKQHSTILTSLKSANMFSLVFFFFIYSKESDESDIEVDIEGNDEVQVTKKWQKERWVQENKRLKLFVL